MGHCTRFMRSRIPASAARLGSSSIKRRASRGLTKVELIRHSKSRTAWTFRGSGIWLSPLRDFLRHEARVDTQRRLGRRADVEPERSRRVSRRRVAGGNDPCDALHVRRHPSDSTGKEKCPEDFDPQFDSPLPESSQTTRGSGSRQHLHTTHAECGLPLAPAVDPSGIDRSHRSPVERPLLVRPEALRDSGGQGQFARQLARPAPSSDQPARLGQ